MRIILFLFFSCISFFCYCQRNQPVIYNNRYQFGLSESRIDVLENKDTVFISKSSYKNTNTNNIDEVELIYKGTPIFNNAWFTNSLLYVDGLETKGNIAYNLLNKDIQFSAGDINKAVVVKPDSFVVSHHKFIHLSKVLKNAHSIYYELLYKNEKIGLYRAFTCSYRPRVDGQATSYHVKIDDYEGVFTKSILLFLAHKGELNELKTNSSFYKYFGEQKLVIEKYVKSNNLSLKKESDLIGVLKYYSSL